MTGKIVTWTRSTRPAAISARFIDRLPCERSGTSDSSLSRAMTSTASPLTRVATGQSSGPCSVVDTTVIGRFLIRVTHGSRASDSSGPEDHPLLRVVEGEAAIEQLRALLTPVAAPVAVVGAVAVEAGKDVPGVGGSHDSLLSFRFGPGSLSGSCISYERARRFRQARSKIFRGAGCRFGRSRSWGW